MSFLGVLAPYRRQGIASQLLSHVLELASSPPAPARAAAYSPRPSTVATSSASKHSKPNKEAANSVKAVNIPRPIKVQLHVRPSSEETVFFLQKKNFHQDEHIKDYYKSLDPQDAYVMAKAVEPAA